MNHRFSKTKLSIERGGICPHRKGPQKGKFRATTSTEVWHSQIQLLRKSGDSHQAPAVESVPGLNFPVSSSRCPRHSHLTVGIKPKRDSLEQLYRKEFQSRNRMAEVEKNITIDPESTSGVLVLNVGEVTLGKKSGKEMQKDKEERHRPLLCAVCALLNSQGGKVRAHIENQDYNYNKHGIGKDLEASFKAILPLAQNHLDFKQEGRCFVISVKSCSLDNSALKPATMATNLYSRNGASCLQMDLDNALQFFKDLEDSALRSPIKTVSFDKRPGEDVREQLLIHRPKELQGQEEQDVQELAADFFNQAELTEANFSFSESKNVEYKSFKTKKLVQRVKDILPKTVSAFANVEGGYLFIGLDEKEKQIVGFKAEKSDLENLEREIEKCIRRLPVTHFCEKQEKIQYTCKFIPVLRPGAMGSYVCALRVERFCCAVFAAEPESWHVEDNCVKRLTLEEWVKILKSSRPG